MAGVGDAPTSTSSGGPVGKKGDVRLLAPSLWKIPHPTSALVSTTMAKGSAGRLNTVGRNPPDRGPNRSLSGEITAPRSRFAPRKRSRVIPGIRSCPPLPSRSPQSGLQKHELRRMWREPWPGGAGYRSHDGPPQGRPSHPNIARQTTFTTGSFSPPPRQLDRYEVGGQQREARPLFHKPNGASPRPRRRARCPTRASAHGPSFRPSTSSAFPGHPPTIGGAKSSQRQVPPADAQGQAGCRRRNGHPPTYAALPVGSRRRQLASTFGGRPTSTGGHALRQAGPSRQNAGRGGRRSPTKIARLPPPGSRASPHRQSRSCGPERPVSPALTGIHSNGKLHAFTLSAHNLF